MTTVKGQVLANVVAEFTEGSEQVDLEETEMTERKIMINTISPQWLENYLSMGHPTRKDRE